MEKKEKKEKDIQSCCIVLHIALTLSAVLLLSCHGRPTGELQDALVHMPSSSYSTYATAELALGSSTMDGRYQKKPTVVSNSRKISKTWRICYLEWEGFSAQPSMCWVRNTLVLVFFFEFFEILKIGVLT